MRYLIHNTRDMTMSTERNGINREGWGGLTYTPIFYVPII